MKQNKNISTLFELTPDRWGLRGDPYLWEEMKQTIGELPLVETEEQLIALVDSAFEQLTGTSLSSGDNIQIERYCHGGMSSGFVSPKFWREYAVPMLLLRLKQMCNE